MDRAEHDFPSRPISPPTAAVAEQHASCLLFSSFNGSWYLFDSATSSIHPWSWSIQGDRLDRLYAISNEQLPRYLHSIRAPIELSNYVLQWRLRAGAFGRPLCHSGDCAHSGDGQLVNDREGNLRDHTLGIRQAPEDGATCHPESSSRRAPKSRLALPAMLGNLILIVTDACNLRCRYCLLGGGYEGFKPLRAQHMSWETAKAAVDHFIALNDSPTFQAMPNRKINIAFFGGEPLLRGDLIRRVVEYSKGLEQPGCGYWIDYAVTSNLTYLPDDLAAFLVEHQVGLQVSLDGPGPIHDRCRVDAAGQGSFAAIRSNLEKLQRLSSDYVKRCVSSVVTVNGTTDLVAVNEFFERDDPLIPRVSFIGLLRDLETSQFHRNFPFDPQAFWEQYATLTQEYLRRKFERVPVHKGQFLYQLFEEPLVNLYTRTMTVGTERRQSYTGTCQPGRRLAVSTDGKFHLCERVNEHFPIGDVTSGVNFARCDELLEHYYDALPDCESCWAHSICGICLAQVGEKGTFVFGARCNHARAEMAHRLRLMCSVLEDRPDAFSVQDPLMDCNLMVGSAL